MLLVRQASGSSSSSVTCGWSLLLPAGWVGPFWQALTHAGGWTLLLMLLHLVAMLLLVVVCWEVLLSA
jgi:hypothetical protein